METNVFPRPSLSRPEISSNPLLAAPPLRGKVAREIPERRENDNMQIRIEGFPASFLLSHTNEAH